MHWFYWKHTLQIQIWNYSCVPSLEHVPLRQLPRHSPLRKVWAGILLVPLLQWTDSTEWSWSPEKHNWKALSLPSPTVPLTPLLSVFLVIRKRFIQKKKSMQEFTWILCKNSSSCEEWLLRNSLRSYSDCLTGKHPIFFLLMISIHVLIESTDSMKGGGLEWRVEVWKAWDSTTLLPLSHINTYLTSIFRTRTGGGSTALYLNISICSFLLCLPYWNLKFFRCFIYIPLRTTGPSSCLLE